MAKIAVIFSSKGGVGKTFLSANIAFSLSLLNKRTLLIDADLEGVGDVARALNVSPQRSLADIMYLYGKNKDFNIDNFITSVSSYLDVVPAVIKPSQIPYYHSTLIKKVFSEIIDKYDFIIVDGGKAFSDSFVRLMDEANLLLLVVTPDILSVYQTKWVLDTLQSLQFPLRMVKVILNRAESASSISTPELKLALTSEIILQVPSEGKLAVLSINRRSPLVKDFPKSKIALSLTNFVKNVLVAKPEIFLEHKEIEEIRGDIRKKMETLDKEKISLFQAFLDTQPSVAYKEDDDEIVILKKHIHKRLIDELNLRRMDLGVFSDPVRLKSLKEKAERLINNFLGEETNALIGSLEVRKKFVKEIIDEALGLGPLEDFLRDPTVSEIMVNNKDEVYVEREGKLEFTSKKFISDTQVKTIIDRIIAPIGRHIDESIPMVDARLPDGSRVNAIIPPLSLTGPTLTIRKFRQERFKITDLINIGTLDKAMADFLKAAVLTRRNIIVSGGTGSGKTTVLNVLSSFISENERIITIEDAAELKLDQRHWIRLEARPPNIEGKGAIVIRDLFRNTLRMRPDRIIIGECRAEETLDMLQAMNTGHDGSMTTVHANSPEDVLVRFDSMILMSGIELPVRAIREMIASAINIIVHTARFSDGSRKITQITEVAGMKDDLHVELKDIFLFHQKGMDKDGKICGVFSPTGYIPTFFEEIKLRGIPLSEEMFTPTF